MGEIALRPTQVSSLHSHTKTSSTKLLIGLAWVIKRKEDPKFSLEHAKRLTMDEITAMLEDDDTDPKVK